MDWFQLLGQIFVEFLLQLSSQGTNILLFRLFLILLSDHLINHLLNQIRTSQTRLVGLDHNLPARFYWLLSSDHDQMVLVELVEIVAFAVAAQLVVLESDL